MVAEHRNGERMEKFIADHYIESCAFCRFNNISRLEIIFLTKSVINHRDRRLQLLKIFIITTCDDAFLHLLSHFFKSIEYIIDSGKIIRMVKINIRHNCVIRVIGQEVTAVFTSFNHKEM